MTDNENCLHYNSSNFIRLSPANNGRLETEQPSAPLSSAPVQICTSFGVLGCDAKCGRLLSVSIQLGRGFLSVESEQPFLLLLGSVRRGDFSGEKISSMEGTCGQ